MRRIWLGLASAIGYLAFCVVYRPTLEAAVVVGLSGAAIGLAVLGARGRADNRILLRIVLGRQAAALHARAAEIASLVESTEDAVIGTTPVGIITSWNRGAELTYGWTAAETIGQPLEMIVPPATRGAVASSMRQLGRGTTAIHHRAFGFHRNGHEIDVDLTVCPVFAGGRLAAVSTVARDVSTAVAAEAEREQLQHDREALLTEAQLQNARLDESHRERTRLLARTVEVAEHERMRIAAQLHDGPIQKLTVVAFNLDRLARRIARNEQGVPQLVGAIRNDVQSQMSALRRLMSELRPPILDERNLSAALNDCATQVFAEASTECETICNLGDELPAPEVETAVFRVVREALINISRHAGATRVQVLVERDGETLRLLVADDGHGFESDAEAGERFGLLGMQERIGSVGGRLQVASVAGAGTRIEATLPWKSRVVVAAA